MRYVSLIGCAVLLVNLLAAAVTRAAGANPQPEPNAVSDGVRVDACSSDPKLLGLSRIVEIDATGGPSFGGGHGQETDFLKDHEVILTFDDGPLRSHTRVVLKALSAHCTKATFFMVGRMAASDPAMVKEVAAQGHTIASHTWSHQNLKAIGLFKGRQEFEMGLAAVNKALGRPVAPFFRFPYLSGNRLVEEHLRRRNVSAIWIDIDSKDYQTRDSALVHHRIMNQLAVNHKGIILMHDIQPSTAGAIKGLLDDLHDKGYKVVHIVPKSGVDAVASYNDAVDKAFAEKSAALAANPLASRSIIWTMAPSAAGAAAAAASLPAPGAAVGSKPKTVLTPAVPEAKPTPSTASIQTGDVLPWQPPSVKKDPAPQVQAQPPQKAKKPARAPAEELPWQNKAFGY